MSEHDQYDLGTWVSQFFYVFALGFLWVQIWSQAGTVGPNNGFFQDMAPPSIIPSGWGGAFMLGFAGVFWLGAGVAMATKDNNNNKWRTACILVTQLFLVLNIILFFNNDFNPVLPTFYTFNTNWRTGTNATVANTIPNFSWTSTASSQVSVGFALFFFSVALVFWLFAVGYLYPSPDGQDSAMLAFMTQWTLTLYLACNASALYGYAGLDSNKFPVIKNSITSSMALLIVAFAVLALATLSLQTVRDVLQSSMGVCKVVFCKLWE